MERVIEIIKEWGFKEGTKGHYYKFVTPDSIATFDVIEAGVIITFKAFCGEQNKELQKAKIRHIISKDIIEHTLSLENLLKDKIRKLVISIHNKYLFNE